jgi:hypothetical protein
MSAFPNINPVTQLNGNGLVNPDSSGTGSFLFTSKVVPNGPHTLPPAGSNIQSAASIYPFSQKGGKINRKKINKISRKYKMKGSKRTIKRRIRRVKSRVRSRYSNRRVSNRRRRRSMKGGSFQSPMTTPNYPATHSQYMNNNGSQSNTYSLGGPLSAGSSALANPPIFNKVSGDVDNLNHNTLNAHNNIGAGSGFPSRGWF